MRCLEVKEYEEFIGIATNNFAEYRALIKALFLQVRGTEKQFEKVNYSHVPREKGVIKRADKLANLAIDEFKIMEREREKEWKS